MRRLYSHIHAASVYIFLLTASSFSLSNFTNYQSVIRINDIVASGKKIWAASSGGLLVIDVAKHAQTFYCDNYSFPDLNLTALAVDSKGNVWIGSKRGYLYKRSADGRVTAFDSYCSVQWGIQDIFIYKDYVIVGSSKGLGIFDPVKGTSIRNSTAIDSSLSASINAITVHNDSLYAACQGSYSAFDISGDKFLNSNYLDLTLWNPTYTNAPIVSFVDSSGILLPQTAPALIAGGTFYHTDGGIDSLLTFTADGQEARTGATSIASASHSTCTIPGAVTVMTSDDAGAIWIGTDQNFLYSWNGTSNPVQYKMPGLTDKEVDRIYAAKNGTVWMLPKLAPDNPPWWEGITSFDGKQWILYNRFSTPGIGMFNGGGPDFIGICEDRNGNMWFGTSGSAARFYNIHTNQWQLFYFGGLQLLPFDSVKQISLADLQIGIFWSRHDALCQDSSGNLWVSNFISKGEGAIKTGCLVCYNPWRGKAPSYRRFFPDKDTYEITEIKSLCVDASNHLFIGGANGRLIVIDPTANPIDNGIRIILDRNDLSSISDICATSDGITWIVTGAGLYKCSSAFLGNDSGLSKIKLDTAYGHPSCVAAETDSIIWLGTSDKGLVRYDAQKDSATSIDRSNGLVANAITSISIDKKNGFLWVGASEGISRYSLGHTSVAVQNNASIIAYPNPYSLSNPNHREIVFAHCAPGAKVYIYTMSGSLVKQLSSPADNAYASDANPFESALHWIPSRKTSPGMYYFVGQSQKPVKTKKLLIVP